jgi:hypothetical protein
MLLLPLTLVTASHTDPSIPQVWEKVGIDSYVSDEIFLVKLRVAQVGSRLGSFYVIVWCSANGNAILEVGRRGVCVVIYGSHANGRRLLADERIKNPSGNLFIDQAARGIATVDLYVVEALVSNARWTTGRNSLALCQRCCFAIS